MDAEFRPVATHRDTGPPVDVARPTVTGLEGHPAVDRARAAQHLVDTIRYQPERFARMRDQAVHAALKDGVCVRRIADALEVLPVDVERMSRSHALRAHQPSTMRPDDAPGVVRGGSRQRD